MGFLNYTRAHFEYYQGLLDAYPECQLCLVDEATGYPIAVGNCVPLACDLANLPPEGWDWIVETAASNNGKPRNALGALAISVPHIHRGKGIARQLIHGFRELAAKRGLDGVIAPVRPSEKWRHPYIAIEDYVGWTDEKGRAYDPWLRSHLSAGGSIVGPAARSMVVEEPVGFWEMWAGRDFPETGDYTVDGALAPVAIDIARGVGRYVEPNIWFAYAA
ncbi:MAG TPA: transferase [Hyphomonadaceae bacterium]|nr:transferase [Hyphomonadaceae bacterium]